MTVNIEDLERASANTTPNQLIRHQAYTSFLALLKLCDGHKTYLKSQRLMTEEKISELGFRTFPNNHNEYSSQLQKLEKGGDGIENPITLKGVPGFYQDEGDGNKWRAIDIKRFDEDALPPLIIPIRDAMGMIVALRVRMFGKDSVDGNGKNQKYRWFSSPPTKQVPLMEPKLDEEKKAVIEDGKPVMIQKVEKGRKIFKTIPHHNKGTKLSINQLLYWPIQNKEKLKSGTIRIIEGEFKAEISSELTNVYTIGCVGVSVAKKALESIAHGLKQSGIKTIRLCFDADKDTATYDGGNTQVREHFNKLVLCCAKLGFNIESEQWDVALGKGLDDMLINGHADEVEILDAFETTKDVMETSGPLGAGAWIIDTIDERVIETAIVDPHDRLTYKLGEQFNRAYAIEAGQVGNGKISATNLIINNEDVIRTRGHAFDPTERFKERYKPYTFHRDRVKLNSFKPYNVTPWDEPVELEDIPWWDEFITKSYPDEKERELLLGYLAYTFQNPGKLLDWAIIIVGNEGTGKSTIKNIMAQLMGEYNVPSIDQHDLEDTNNTGWREGALLVFGEEIKAKRRGSDFYESLKTLITESRFTFVEKYMKKRQAERRHNTVLLTNYPEAIQLNTDQRRFVFVRSVMPMNTEYASKEKVFSPLYEALGMHKSFGEAYEMTEGIQKLARWFNDYDLTKFLELEKDRDTRMTATTQECVAVSDEARMNIGEMIDHREWPFSMEVLDLRKLVPELHARGITKAGRNNIRRKIEELGYAIHRVKGAIDDGTENPKQTETDVIFLRNKDEWELTLKQCKSEVRRAAHNQWWEFKTKAEANDPM